MDETTDPFSAYSGTWYAATKVDAPPRPPLTVDLDVDVCVIGGGLAGLTTAREVARSGWSVVLIEAGQLAENASGRNTGFVLPGFAAAPDRIIGRVGFSRAKDLWSLSQSGLDYVRDTVADGLMPGVDPQDGWLYVSKVDNGDPFMHLARLFGEFGVEIEGWPAKQVRATLRSERYFHAIHFPRAINIHPLNYALGLAAAAERAGARIFEHTPALSIDPAGVRKRIVTPNARLRANHVVLCGNNRIAGLMPPIAAALIPITTYVITTAPLGPLLAETIDYRGSVSDSDLAGNHYRIVGGDRLMWSGRATTWERDPRRYVRALAADIKRTYPQLGEVGVDYAWSGTLGNSLHRMPQIGELGPGVWLASGFGGHGLNTTAMAGNLIARAIVDGDQTWRQFTPFELVWAGGIFGRAVAQTSYWIRRLRAATAERRARAAERAHRMRHADLGKTDEAQSSASPQDNVRTEADAQSMPPPPAAAQGRERREGT
ncbi:MAG: FAD-binding oxidoreductase [Xanthobacteraceae bacterium]|nr:FAD-binding oxidoreductase [Xanthobacteraceae bacterium]